MKITAVLLSLLSLSAAVVNLPILKGSFDEDVHIVVFHENTTSEQRSRHFLGYQPKIKYTYDFGTFHGYAAWFNQSSLSAVRSASEVHFTEANGVAHVLQETCSKQNGATWGINRVDERVLNLNGVYTYSSTGENVVSYVVDTGIYTANQDFGGRAVHGANFIAGETNADCNGHGTHVAGTIGGTLYGIAKKTTLVAVKVLSCQGSGSWDGILKGIEFTVTDSANRKKRAVANMSLGGGKSAALNAAVAGAVNAGVVMVVAAGNENQDACNVSPASEPLAITVGATDKTDTRSTFSNYGKCVDIFAPGTAITSPWIGGVTAVSTISGTSMAAPHVAGIATLYLQNNPTVKAADVSKNLVSVATSGSIKLKCTNTACQQSPNKMAFVQC